MYMRFFLLQTVLNALKIHNTLCRSGYFIRIYQKKDKNQSQEVKSRHLPHLPWQLVFCPRLVRIVCWIFGHKRKIGDCERLNSQCDIRVRESVISFGQFKAVFFSPRRRIQGSRRLHMSCSEKRAVGRQFFQDKLTNVLR